MKVLKPTVLQEGPPLSRQMRRPSASQRTLLHFGSRAVATVDTFKRTSCPTAPSAKRVVSSVFPFGPGRVSQFGFIE